MARIVSVDKSHEATGSVKNYVTLQQADGSQSRVEVSEEDAQRLKEAMGGPAGPRLLTETLP